MSYPRTAERAQNIARGTTAHLLVDDGADEALPGVVYQRGHCSCGAWSIGIAPPVEDDALRNEFQQHGSDEARAS